MIDYLDLVDYLLIAEAVTGIPAGTLAKLPGIDLADSALHAPHAEFGEVEFHPDFVAKAAVLCARLLRNHPLPDGNKRAACEEIPDYPPQSFSRENGRDLLLRSFRNADRVDCDGALVFRTRERLVRYVNALVEGKDAVDRVPELSEPFRLPFTASVFVANAPR